VRQASLLVALPLAAAWLGAALLFAAAVAPAAFAVLPARALAGAVVGRVLPVIFLTGLAVGIAIAALEASSAVAPFRRWRLAAGAAMMLACAVAQFGVAPRIESLRASIGPSIEALARDDARRARFGRLHAISVGWMGIAMLAAGVVVVSGALALRTRP
jgi:hypothetical protein